MVEELMRVLSGVVYRLNRIGPRMEPWRTPHVREDEGDMCGGMEVVDREEGGFVEIVFGVSRLEGVK